MGKDSTSIRIDSSLLEMARNTKGFILSHFFEEQLRLYFNVNKEDVQRIQDLEQADKEIATEMAKISILREKKRLLEEEAEAKRKEDARWRRI